MKSYNLTQGKRNPFLGTVIAAGIAGWIGINAPVLHAEPATPAAGAATTSTASLAALKAQLDSVDHELTAGNLNRIHQFAEAINAAVKDLDKDPSLDATKQKRVTGYIKNIAKLTDGMHDAADEKKLDETMKWDKKLKAQVDLLAKQFSNPAKAALKKAVMTDSTGQPMKM